MKNYDQCPVNEWNHLSFPIIRYQGELDPESASMRFLSPDVNIAGLSNQDVADPFRIPAFEQPDSFTDEVLENASKE